MSKIRKKSLIFKMIGGLVTRTAQVNGLIDVIYGDKNKVTKLEAVCLVSNEVVNVFNAEDKLVIGDPLADLLISVCSDYYSYKSANRNRELSPSDIKRESIYNIANAVGIALISRRQLIKSETLADALKVVVDDLTAFESQVAA